MASSFQTTLQHLLTRLQSLAPHLLTPRNTILSALSVPIFYLIYKDYRTWLSNGRGGLPQNPLGYLVVNILRPLKPSPFDTSFVSNPRMMKKFGKAGEKSYLSEEDVPIRKGERPTICKHLLPQRQLDQKGWAGESRERFNTLITSLASDHPTELHTATSVLERTGLALHLSPSVANHPGTHGTRNEIAHSHESDGSMHMCLAPRDAKLVIERGWGERFGLSGSLLPVSYTMVYAPRGEEEMVVVERIVRASVKFILDGEA